MTLHVKPEHQITHPASVTLSNYILVRDLHWRKGDGDTVYYAAFVNLSLDELKDFHKDLGDFIRFIEDNQ